MKVKAEDVVLQAIFNSKDGLIAPEIATLTGLPLNTVSPRTRPLVNKGLIVADGKRKGPNGRNQSVWKMTPATAVVN